MLEGKVWVTCLRRYGKCMVSRRKEKQQPIYTTILSARMTMKTREKEVGIRLTLRNCQGKQEQYTSNLDRNNRRCRCMI